MSRFFFDSPGVTGGGGNDIVDLEDGQGDVFGAGEVEDVATIGSQSAMKNILQNPDIDLEMLESLENNIAVLKEHSIGSLSRFFGPKSIRLLLQHEEYITIDFLDALYNPQVNFIFFVYISDEYNSCLLLLDKMKNRHGRGLSRARLNIYRWNQEAESVVQEGIVDQIRAQNLRVELVNHRLPGKVKGESRLLYLVELVSHLFPQVEKTKVIARHPAKLFKLIERKVKQPPTISFRQWNGEEPKKLEAVSGRIEKFIFTVALILVNAVLAIMLFFLSTTVFSWLFFSLVLVSLMPKVYASWRYFGAENGKEKLGYYQDNFLDPDEDFSHLQETPATRGSTLPKTALALHHSFHVFLLTLLLPALLYYLFYPGWADVSIEIFRSPNWLLKDINSNVYVSANTPMYDESLDEIRRTLSSYLSVVREYPYLEPTFLIDKVPSTYKMVMQLMFDPENLVERNGVYHVLNDRTSVKHLKNMQILYQGYWRGMHNRRFNIVWKPRGGGKRDSQLLFLQLIHLGLISKPRDGVLYLDADTSFTPKDFGCLYNGLMKNKGAGAACGEVQVRNRSFTNLYTMAQSYEYLVNHMLAKSAESWLGVVLCCPGAWCMYRVDALEALLPKYCGTPKSIREFHRLEQGEDRYQNSLCLVGGWEAIMVKSSVAETHVPDTLAKLTEQRRRWNNSTLENTFVVLSKSELWARAPFYMVALALDTLGFYLSPSIFLTLFGSSLGAFVANEALIIAFFAIILIWILIQFSAGLSLFPRESAGLFGMSSIFGAFLMCLVGLIALLQMTVSLEDQAPLIAGLLVYATILFVNAYRFGGWGCFSLIIVGGLSYVIFLPTFYITFLLYSVTRYDTTSWR